MDYDYENNVDIKRQKSKRKVPNLSEYPKKYLMLLKNCLKGYVYKMIILFLLIFLRSYSLIFVLYYKF